jgi:glutathione reductase (NADPH)
MLAGRNERALYNHRRDANDKIVGAHDQSRRSEILQIVCCESGFEAQFDESVAIHPTMAEELVLLR